MLETGKIDFVPSQSSAIIDFGFHGGMPCDEGRLRLAIELAVTWVFGVRHCDIVRATRGRARVALARQVAMYLAHVVFGLSLTQVGLVFGRDRTTVAHACSVIEDRRDDACFDRALDLLAQSIPALLTPRAVPETRQH